MVEQILTRSVFRKRTEQFFWRIILIRVVVLILQQRWIRLKIFFWEIRKFLSNMSFYLGLLKTLLFDLQNSCLHRYNLVIEFIFTFKLQFQWFVFLKSKLQDQIRIIKWTMICCRAGLSASAWVDNASRTSWLIYLGAEIYPLSHLQSLTEKAISLMGPSIA